jgi:hypothetical protein
MDRWQKFARLPILNILYDAWIAPMLAAHDQVPPTDRFRVRRMVPAWLDRRFVKAHQVERLPLKRLASHHYRSSAFQWRHERLLEASEHINRGLFEDIVEFRYPLLDRRVVEFLMATPWQQLLRPGETRSLLRRSMVGLLPDTVRRRKDKSGPGHSAYLAFQRQWHRFEPLTKDPLVCQLGYVDLPEFTKAMNQARLGHCLDLPCLLSVLALEQWLRAVHGLGPPAASAVPVLAARS